MCSSEELLRGQEAELLITIRSILSKHRLITTEAVFFYCFSIAGLAKIVRDITWNMVT